MVIIQKVKVRSQNAPIHVWHILVFAVSTVECGVAWKWLSLSSIVYELSLGISLSHAYRNMAAATNSLTAFVHGSSIGRVLRNRGYMATRK